MSPITKRCAVYARVSTDMQAESLENQVEYATEYIRRLGEDFRIDESCVYTDFDMSGYYTRFIQRPAIQQALHDAQEHRYEVIVFKEISRISRDQAEHIEIVSRFSQYGVRIIAINDNMDSDRPETLDLLGIHSVMAEMESKRISSRVSTGKKSLARRGFWSGEAPIGYVLNSETRRLDPDLTFAEIPKLIFKLFVDDKMGTFKIAEYLNNRKLLTKNGRLWSRVTVNRVLKNPAYAGDLVYGRTRNTLKRIFDDDGYHKVQGRMEIPKEDWVVIPGCHPPLVDRQTFEAAQRIFRQRASQNPRRTRHPLSGILQCGSCSSGMVCQSRRQNGVAYRYYTCSRAFRFGREYCDQQNLPAGLLEKAIWTELMRQLRVYETAHMEVSLSRKDSHLVRKRKQLLRDRNKTQIALERLLLDTELPLDMYEQLKSHYAKNLRQIDSELQSMSMQNELDLQNEFNALKTSQFLDELSSMDESNLNEIRRVMHELVKRIVVHGRHVTEIELQYHLVPICSTTTHPQVWGCLKNTALGPSSSG